MARLMLKAHNLLALDEPTNHMDIRSKDILKQALQAYDGTIIWSRTNAISSTAWWTRSMNSSTAR